MSSRDQHFRSAKPTPGGIYDYLLGGHHCSKTDREAAEKALAIAPELRSAALDNRGFLQRAVRYAAEQGVGQYIDLGSGFPTVGAVHEIAGRVVSNPHVLYVDYDPFVATFSQEMLKPYPYADIIARDLRHPWDIIDASETSRLIDWTEPVAVLMVAIMHFVSDDDNPGEIVATFRDHMAPGSYLILSHASHGENAENAEDAARIWDDTRSSIRLRTPSEIDSLFVGFEMVEPGLVTVTEWGTDKPAPTGQALVLGGVGRVP
jgi:hypothetical protein